MFLKDTIALNPKTKNTIKKLSAQLSYLPEF